MLWGQRASDWSMTDGKDRLGTVHANKHRKCDVKAVRNSTGNRCLQWDLQCAIRLSACDFMDGWCQVMWQIYKTKICDRFMKIHGNIFSRHDHQIEIWYRNIRQRIERERKYAWYETVDVAELHTEEEMGRRNSYLARSYPAAPTDPRTGRNACFRQLLHQKSIIQLGFLCWRSILRLMHCQWQNSILLVQFHLTSHRFAQRIRLWNLLDQ